MHRDTRTTIMNKNLKLHAEEQLIDQMSVARDRGMRNRSLNIGDWGTEVVKSIICNSVKQVDQMSVIGAN